MKYIKGVVVSLFTIAILFSMCGCNKKDKQTNVSFNENPDEMVSELLAENKNASKPKNKYKTKLMLEEEDRAPNISDYNFENSNEDNAEYDKDGNIKHEFKDGICVKCGKADINHPNVALQSLIVDNGVYSKKNYAYSVDNVVGDDVYSIVYDHTIESTYLCHTKYKGKNILYKVFVDLPTDKKTFSIRYNEYKSDGCIVGSSCKMQAGIYTTNTPIKLSDYEGSNKEGAEKNAKNSCNVLMKVFNDFLKDTNAGLKIRHFGFVEYTPIGSDKK